MRPGYLIVGTKRGGTTSLAAWVYQHPQVAPCRNNKGTHYFDINYWRGPKWYFSRFEKPRDGWTITGEASPYYMYHPAGAERIAATLPEVKLIAVLRDPVERAWSQYRYEVARGHETESVERALELEPERIRGERERLMADPKYPGMPYRHNGYLERGHYAEQLERIYAKFPRDQMLVLCSEEMYRDPNGQLARVWKFLDLDPMDSLEGTQARNANLTSENVPPAIRELLSEYYRPLNEELYELTGIDFGWTNQVST
ncbi:MAG: sulfotransferase domain-containing protein [Nocardioidaceae bacterium]